MAGRQEKEQTLIQTQDVRVRILTLQEAETTRWHYHTHVTDHIFCLEGEIEVQVRDPEEKFLLSPGGRCEIRPHRAHAVLNRNAAASRYLLIQGIGVYDFVSV